MDADMTLQNHHEPTPPARVFGAVVRRKIDMGLAELFHAEDFREFIKASDDQVLVVQPFKTALITVNGEVLAEVAGIHSLECPTTDGGVF